MQVGRHEQDYHTQGEREKDSSLGFQWWVVGEEKAQQVKALPSLPAFQPWADGEMREVRLLIVSRGRS